MTEEMQAEACVAEEGQVRAGVGEGDRGMRMAQQLLHLVLVGVEQAAVEHRVELTVEAEVEKDVERIPAALLRQLGDAPTDERTMRLARHAHDRQVGPRLV